MTRDIAIPCIFLVIGIVAGLGIGVSVQEPPKLSTSVELGKCLAELTITQDHGRQVLEMAHEARSQVDYLIEANVILAGRLRGGAWAHRSGR